jgi:UDP-N-acetylmuramoyl-tripeptide--D-alanyl-D-alanine ligase
MKTRNLLYLAQLEEYDQKRIKFWLKNHPGKTVPEIKHTLKLTPKTRLIYFLTSLFSLFVSNEKALFETLNLLKPFDSLIKKIFISLATFKFKLFNKNTTVIAITGSWGKTTLKENLYSVLKNLPGTYYTPANYNTLLAISKKVLSLPVSAKIFICEIGAYESGDIKKVCQIIKPQIGIITAIGPMHLERFGSLENILKTKMELAENIKPNGVVWLPESLKKEAKNFSLPKHVNFFNNYEDIYLSVGNSFNLPSQTIKTSLNSFVPAEHRQQIIKNGPITVIDDTYNSNPAGFKLALDKLKNIKAEYNILVTPGMIELGNLQAIENEKIAKYAASICDRIIIVGETNRESFIKGIKQAHTKTEAETVASLAEAQKSLNRLSTPNTAILFENDLPDHYF